jgi:hypothetical protein
MKVDTAHREHLVPISAKVPSALAAAVSQLADQGNRTVSREVCGALAEHVRNAGVSSPRSERSQTTLGAPAESSAQARQSSAWRTGQEEQ